MAARFAEAGGVAEVHPAGRLKRRAAIPNAPGMCLEVRRGVRPTGHVRNPSHLEVGEMKSVMRLERPAKTAQHAVASPPSLPTFRPGKKRSVFLRSSPPQTAKVSEPGTVVAGADVRVAGTLVVGGTPAAAIEAHDLLAVNTRHLNSGNCRIRSLESAALSC